MKMEATGLKLEERFPRGLAIHKALKKAGPFWSDDGWTLLIEFVAVLIAKGVNDPLAIMGRVSDLIGNEYAADTLEILTRYKGELWRMTAKERYELI